jgi:hypothetical protein
MKLSRLVCRNVALSWLLLAALINSAIGGMPGTCSDMCISPKCGSSGSSGVPCKIIVSETNGPNGPVSGVDKKTVCVSSNTKISWSSDPESEFHVIFGTSHPFPATTHGKFDGKQGQSVGDTASIPPHSSACYQYSVEHCITGQKCAQVDPKVIVTSGTDDDKHSKDSIKK